MVADLEAHAQKTLKTDLEQTLASWTELDLIANADQYLTAARNDRSLATACRIAFQWHQRDPDRHKAQMLKERFIEDLVWNQIHLGKPATAYLSAKTVTQNAVGAGRIPDNEL